MARALWTGSVTVGLADFVPYEDIDPTFFAHSYLVGPPEGAEKTYALLVRAMSESQLAGIGKFVMRNRQYLGCLRVRDKVLTLEQLYFADEVDPPSGIVPKRLPTVGKRELELALNVIDGFTAAWDPKKYKDTYTNALRALVHAKLKGKEIHRAAEAEPGEAPDLMEALRLSVEHVQRARRATRKRSPSGRKTRTSTAARSKSKS